MKCPKCQTKVKKGVTECPNCHTKLQSNATFSEKLKAENEANDHQAKQKEKEIKRQQEVIEKRNLTNKYIVPSIVFGAIGTVFVLWPAGIMVQRQWWYLLLTIGFGAIGYYYNMKARKLNAQYYQRYRVVVNGKSMKLGLYLSSFTLFGAMLIVMFIISTMPIQ